MAKSSGPPQPATVVLFDVYRQLMQQIALQEGMTSANHSFPSGSVVQPSVQDMTGPVPTAGTGTPVPRRILSPGSNVHRHSLQASSTGAEPTPDERLDALLQTQPAPSLEIFNAAMHMEFSALTNLVAHVDPVGIFSWTPSQLIGYLCFRFDIRGFSTG